MAGANGKRRPDLDTEEIVRRYESGASTKQIAAELGCAQRTVLMRLRKAGTTVRSCGRPQPRGPASPYWKGGRVRQRKGYWLINVDGKFLLEHHHLIEQAIGRPLTADEIVHHLDGSKDNNDLANLFLLTRRQHPQLHAKQTRYCRAGHPPISDEERAEEPFASWWLERHLFRCEALGAEAADAA